MTDETKEDEYVSRRIRQMQAVRFSNSVTVTEIPTHRHYTFDERIACWYTMADFRVFSLENKLDNKKSQLADNHINDLGLKVLKALGVSQDQYNKQMTSRKTKELLDASMRVLVARRLAEQRLAQAKWYMPCQEQQQVPSSIPNFTFNPLYGTKDDRMLTPIPLVLPNSVVPMKTGTTPLNEPKSPIARGA